MSGKVFECGYGAIVQEDVRVLKACLFSLWGPHDGIVPVRVVEIGMHDGGTARGIESFLVNACRPLDYYGIDVDDGTTRPRYVPAGGKVIIGDSAEVYAQVPGGVDLLWVDGCHCKNHVILDTVHYTPKVRIGGFVCFHDVNPAGEGQERQLHGPDTPDFGLAVNQGLRAISFPWPGWEFFMELVPTDVRNCGTRAYRRTRG